jgi:hypothetical protein
MPVRLRPEVGHARHVGAARGTGPFETRWQGRQASEEAALARYFVVYRAHDATASLNRWPRPHDIPKPELIQLCFLSLLDALKPVPHRIRVVGDALSEPSLRFFRSFGVELSNETLGSVAAARRAIEVGCEAPDDEWVYVCEDDYLHRPDCFERIDDLVENREKYLECRPREWWKRPFFGGIERDTPLFIYPADAPSFYTARRQHSLLFQSQHCHWRQIRSVPLTFLIRARELRRRQHILDHRRWGKIEGKKRSRALFAGYAFWGKALGLSPIPALANHLHVGAMTPFGDWDERLAQYRARLAALPIGQHTSCAASPRSGCS